MDIETLRCYTLSLPGVTEDQPFGEDIITFRIEGKIFFCLWLGGGKYDKKMVNPDLHSNCRLRQTNNYEMNIRPSNRPIIGIKNTGATSTMNSSTTRSS